MTYTKELQQIFKSTKKLLTTGLPFSIINFASRVKPVSNFIMYMNSEKYSRGRRGAPAKGVGR